MSDTRAEAVSVLGCDTDKLRQTIARLSLHLATESVVQLADRLQRDPTLAELTLVNSMWSEHCSYKSTRALLRTLPTQAPNVVMGPGADAGIVRLPRVGADGRVDLANIAPGEPVARCLVVAHESHNHPSQVLPYEGAATGIGGIVRDVYCMGADVVGVLDILRFGDPHGPQGESVRQIVQGVVEGIAGYGNALGVPNLGGGIEFDGDFDDNCLVNVVALGVLWENEVIPSRAPEVAAKNGYVMMLVGKPTDDSGLGGAAFASVLMETDESHQDRGAVQLPDPFFKRVLTEANRAAIKLLHKHGAPFAIKDLGAAGFGGASSELAGDLGIRIDLDAIHCDRPGRPAAVLMVAETQERYVFAVPADIAADLQSLYEEEFEIGAIVRGAGARVVGKFNEGGHYQATRHGQLHIDLPTTLISEAWEVEWPRSPRPAVVEADPANDPHSAGDDLAKDVESIVGSVHGASRYPVFAHFDSDVQGNTVFRPGEADAGIFLPQRNEPLAIAIGSGGPARLGTRDAWRAGASAVCEAVRNVVAVGATPWVMTDCLNFGSPETPNGMQDLVDAVRGLGDAARTIGLPGHPGSPLPFVSGNVSLYNESHSGRAIPPTPIVACFGLLADASAARSNQFRSAGDMLYRLGQSESHLGGSLLAQTTQQRALLESGRLSSFDIPEQRDMCMAVLQAYDARLLSACHDIADGGELLAVLEMAWGRRGDVQLGARWQASRSVAQAGQYASLFGESAGFLCAVAAENCAAFERLMETNGITCEKRGQVTEAADLQVQWGTQSATLALRPLATLWRHALEEILETQAVAT